MTAHGVGVVGAQHRGDFKQQQCQEYGTGDSSAVEGVVGSGNSELELQVDTLNWSCKCLFFAYSLAVVWRQPRKYKSRIINRQGHPIKPHQDKDTTQTFVH